MMRRGMRGMEGCEGGIIEGEPRCEADEGGKHRYRDMSRREDLNIFYVTEQCHECRIVRETGYGPGEVVERRRYYDPGRWLEAEE